MGKTFEEALADLIGEYRDTTETDDLISAMEIQIMALKEETD